MALPGSCNRSLLFQACLLALALLARKSQARVDVGGGHIRFLENNDDHANNDDANSNMYDASVNCQDGSVPEICEDGIVQVSCIKTVCDSPYTFYYGNGANRNSRYCNSGDKATITVYFNVWEDLTDTSIYTVMSIYAGYGNEVLTSTSPKNLKKYVGYSCNAAGSYSFTYSTTIGSASSGSSNAFVPYIQIAFSSETNGDYNLGAANIPCNWDDREFGEWTEVAQMSTQFSLRDFLVEYGIFAGVVALSFLFIAIFAKRTIDNGKFIKKLRSLRARQAANDKTSALMPPEATAV